MRIFMDGAAEQKRTPIGLLGLLDQCANGSQYRPHPRAAVRAPSTGLHIDVLHGDCRSAPDRADARPKRRSR